MILIAAPITEKAIFNSIKYNSILFHKKKVNFS